MPTITPEAALPLVETFCEVRNPDHLREEVQLEVHPAGEQHHDQRAQAAVARGSGAGMDRTDLKVAQLRYDPSERTWSLYCRNRHGRWFLYDGIQPATSIVPLLTEIDEDPTGIFWG